YEGINGIGVLQGLNIEAQGDRVIFSKTLADGIVFERTIAFTNDYLLAVRDRFINSGSTSWKMPGARILTGRMRNPADMKTMKGISILGVDSYTPAGGINYWGRKLNSLFKQADKPETIDAVPEEMHNEVVDWVATKNKFFVQILSPQEPEATMSVLSSRNMSEKGIVPTSIAAALVFNSDTLDAGETLERNYTCFIGPKKYSILKAAGNNMEGVMEFETIGFWSFMNWLMEPARKSLLWTLNLFHGVVRNYGIAIILLTLLVRILFWPLTHKSTESMKRM
ncbi:MAG: membrane protein insertase YidC, partial [Kiritimatiellales bacterium]|nr:membrane protein insertase YidC [Kiritimatiellales bacterium]